MKNKNLISISGKKGSGKDTVGKIIQYFTLWQVIRSKEYDNPEQAIGGSSTYKNKPLSEWTWEERMSHGFFNGELKKSNYHIKRWADALKQICSIILNVPVSKFEDQEFKASELGEEWWYWNRYNSKIFKSSGSRVPYKGNKHLDNGHNDLFKPTVRWLLQNIGTEVGRNIHANMWVNTLMNQYKTKTPGYEAFVGTTESQWIITDTRFENELQAIQDRNGICVKVEKSNDDARITYASEKAHNDLIDEYNSEDSLYKELLKPIYQYKDEVQDKFNKLYDKYEQEYLSQQHKSETNLDHVKEWDWVFNNNGSIEDLVEQVKEFLTHFKII